MAEHNLENFGHHMPFQPFNLWQATTTEKDPLFFYENSSVDVSESMREQWRAEKKKNHVENYSTHRKIIIRRTQ